MLDKRNIRYKLNFQSHKLSSIFAGEKIKYLIMPKCENELIYTVNSLISCCIPYKIIGLCTNTMFCHGSEELAVVSTRLICDRKISDNRIRLSSGSSFIRTQRELMTEGKYISLPMCGIPGSIGGMVRQNAGSYGECISDIFISGRVYSPDENRIYSIGRDEMHFSYRESILSSSNLILIDAVLSLREGEDSYIKDKFQEITKKRREAQPSERSLGSFFKRPCGDYAARLIDECGLKGFRIGDACVSDKHAGFIVNLGHATADDIIAVGRCVKNTVFEKHGIMLDTEVELVGIDSI